MTENYKYSTCRIAKTNEARFSCSATCSLMVAEKKRIVRMTKKSDANKTLKFRIKRSRTVYPENSSGNSVIENSNGWHTYSECSTMKRLNNRKRNTYPRISFRAILQLSTAFLIGHSEINRVEPICISAAPLGCSRIVSNNVKFAVYCSA